MFFLKKAISRFFFPVPLVLEMLLLGWLIHRYTKMKRLGKGLIAAAGLLFVALAYPWAGNWMVTRLERTYPPLALEKVGTGVLPSQVDILVLGQGLSRVSGNPGPSQVNGSLLARIMEAVRLHRQIPGSRILLSIGGINPPASEDLFIAKMTEVVGVNPAAIVKIPGALDTADEINAARKLARESPIIVVTSASHMPRAMLIAQKAGVKAIAAPCDFQAPDPEKDDSANWTPANLFPSAGCLATSERAFYEYLGLTLERFRAPKASQEKPSLGVPGAAVETGGK